MSDCSVTPRTVAHQIPLSMKFSRQEYWNGLPFPSPGDLPHPRTEPTSPALAVGFFTTLPPGKPSMMIYNRLKDQQALFLDSKLSDMHLTESEDIVVHTDFSYTDNALSLCCAENR